MLNIIDSSKNVITEVFKKQQVREMFNSWGYPALPSPHECAPRQCEKVDGLGSPILTVS